MQNILKNNYICRKLQFQMEQEEKIISEINNELNINGKILTQGDVSIVVYGHSSSLNLIDFININKEIKRLVPININPIYNLEFFDCWSNSYNKIKESKYILIFKNSNLFYYSYNIKNIKK